MKAPGTVFDIECNGFNPDRIHCLSLQRESKVVTCGGYVTMRSFCSSERVLVGHNIVRFDVPILERLLTIKVEAELVDTLALSWYLYPDRKLHGLADWGEEFGIPKPKVEDWDNQPYEVYNHRCEEDVRINVMLWEKIWAHLLELYGSEEKAWRLIDYLTFKVSCAGDQERHKWRLDVERCVSSLESLSEERDRKVAGLVEVMPQQPVWASMAYPKKPYLMSGKLSVQGEKYNELRKDLGENIFYQGELKYIKGHKPPNPNSHIQVKDWLYSLGWGPITFKYKRNKETNEFRKIEQVRDDGELCSSVLKLDHPGIPILEGLTILNHRISILEGFLRDEEDGMLKARIGGLTNTLRFKHRELVNLPGVDKPYGDIIRGCLIAPDGYELAGSDMCGLENCTKQHYMWDYDPDYVTEMSQEGFDSHLDIAVLAGMMTQEESDSYKNGDMSKRAIRHDAKQVNYSCDYGVTPGGIVRNTGMSLRKAEKLHKTNKDRNWSLDAIADSCIVKKVQGQNWLYNPVSQLWYSLRKKRDRFSTLNQGTGVWCFDTWIKYVRMGGPPIIGQFHDEVCIKIKKGKRDRLTKHLKEAMGKANKELQLNRTLDIDIQFGNSYGEIH